MTIARGQQINTSMTRWYHCVSRCVRRRSCSAKGRLTEKSGSKFGSRNLQNLRVGIGGFSVMDNHLHLLVRLDPDVAGVGRTRRS